MIKLSLFVRDPFKGRDRHDRPRWAFNPYVVIGGYELCIDRHGFMLSTPARVLGFIRGSGFYHRAGYRFWDDRS